MPIFNGSLVDELLNELSSRLAAAPELIETYDLEDVRFQLSVLVADKLSSERRRDLNLQGAAPPQDDEVEAADLEGAGCVRPRALVRDGTAGAARHHTDSPAPSRGIPHADRCDAGQAEPSATHRVRAGCGRALGRGARCGSRGAAPAPAACVTFVDVQFM